MWTYHDTAMTHEKKIYENTMKRDERTRAHPQIYLISLSSMIYLLRATHDFIGDSRTVMRCVRTDCLGFSGELLSACFGDVGDVGRSASPITVFLFWDALSVTPSWPVRERRGDTSDLRWV